MAATWERHRVIPLTARRRGGVRTILSGPTCMAFDNLGVHDLPSSVREGDAVLCTEAGAYQMSWETRFARGLEAVVWCEGPGVDVFGSASGLMAVCGGGERHRMSCGTSAS